VIVGMVVVVGGDDIICWVDNDDDDDDCGSNTKFTVYSIDLIVLHRVLIMSKSFCK